MIELIKGVLNCICDDCDFNYVCLDEPIDAPECSGYRNIEKTALLKCANKLKNAGVIKEYDKKKYSEILNLIKELEDKYTDIYGVPIIEMYAEIFTDLKCELEKRTI